MCFCDNHVSVNENKHFGNIFISQNDTYMYMYIHENKNGTINPCVPELLLQ